MVCLLILGIMHPGRALVGPDSNLPKKTRTEKKVKKAEKKAMNAMSEHYAFEFKTSRVVGDSSAASSVNQPRLS